MKSLTSQRGVESFMLEQGLDPAESLQAHVLALLTRPKGCNSESPFGGKLSAMTQPDLVLVLAYCLRGVLAHSRQLPGDREPYGWLVGSHLCEPADWHTLTTAVDDATRVVTSVVESTASLEGLEEVLDREPQSGEIPAAYATLRARWRNTTWLKGMSRASSRSLLGMLKPYLEVSEEERLAAFARWLLSQPLESTDSAALWRTYSVDHRPGGARQSRRSKDDDSTSGEFSAWLTTLNGGPLTRGKSSYLVRLDSAEFIEAVQHVLKQG